MHTKFQANPIRFDNSNSDLISASLDFLINNIFQHIELSISIWTKLEIDLFNYFYKTYIHSIHSLKVISWIYPIQINPNLITKHLSIQSSYSKLHCIFIQFNQRICTQMKWSTRDIPWLAHDHPTCKLQLNYLQTIKYIQWITNNLNYSTCMM